MSRKLFDSHCHIIDHRFPIVANRGFSPPPFPLKAYLAEARPFQPSDIDLIKKVLGPALAQKTYWDNPVALYRRKS